MSRRDLTVIALILAVVVGGLLGSSANGMKMNVTVISCLHHSEFQYKQHPRNCSFFARQYYQDGTLRRFRDIEGRQLRWSGWGSKTASAVGKFETAEPMKVVAFDLISCPGGGASYGKVLILGRPGGGKGEFHLRLARCGAKRFPPLSAAGSTTH